MWDSEKLILILARFSGGTQTRWIIIGQNLRDQFSSKLGQRFCGCVTRAGAGQCLIYSCNDMDSVELLCTKKTPGCS